MTEQELLKLEGHLLATQAAIRGLILASPDAKIAARAVLDEINKLAAAALPSTLPDALVTGIDDAKQRLLPSKRDWLARG
ncbi:hypothetical protein [Paraburkholderia sp.]|uniref:hypothetical protein n=1 Tax=Paraburkholderia sp. TaxID=1926495 RepID=UPI00286EE511|nr:hypothetical protein [Paraburkholderia sp.]